MSLSLRPGVSFCVSGDRAVFLDRERDRYVGLDPLRTRHLLAGRVEFLGDLLDRGLVEQRDGAPPPRPCEVWIAVRDLDADPLPRARMSDLPLVFAAVFDAWLSLRVKPLEAILSARKRRHAETRSSPAQIQVEALARRFAACRPLLPVSSICLLDSLALCTFLAWRGAGATLVFGVDMPPFTAHAWVQAEDCVLNDAFERTAIYEPILAIDL